MEELRRSAVCTDEIVFDGTAEQGVELDYVLPDYCPDIFKVLSCTLTPRIVSYFVSGDNRLNIDGVVYIKVLYLGENDRNIRCIDQRYSYSKTVDLGHGQSGEISEPPVITLQPKPDHCVCRAVSPRRIDVRGAVSCRIKAAASVEYELPELSDKLLVRTEEISCCGKTLRAQKTLTVREEIDTGASGIAFIMQSSAVPKITDLRVIADKAVLKGTVTVNALYGVKDEENGGAAETERMTADIPISAILDISGITSAHRAFPEITVMNCELTPSSESESGGIISCELLIECRAAAQLEQTVRIPTDVYSTEYETEITTRQLKAAAAPRILPQTFMLRTNVNADKGEIRSIYDASAALRNVRCIPEKGSIRLTGQLCTAVCGVNADGETFYCEKQENIEQTVTADDISADCYVEAAVNVVDTGFSIASDGSVEVSASVDLRAGLHDIIAVDAVEAVTVHEDKPKPKQDEFALRICYSDENSDCWSVAKRYNTTVEAIMEENGLSSADEPLCGMIIIPTA